jgi:hypothetical protein
MTDHETINIITRTSNRPNFFSDCYRSVSGQTDGNNLVHWITSDDDDTFNYLKPYENVRLVPITRPRRKNKQHFPYNKYLHEVMNIIDNSGWVMVLDDDDLLASSDSINHLREAMRENDYNDQAVFIWRVKNFNGKQLPSDSVFGSDKLDPDEVTNNCFCFHVKHKDLINFESRVKAEFNVLSTLIKCLKPIWIDQVITEIGNSDPNGGQGNRQDKVVTKPKISFKAKGSRSQPEEAEKVMDPSPKSETLEVIPVDQISQYSDHDSVETASTAVFTPTKEENVDQVIEIKVVDYENPLVRTSTGKTVKSEIRNQEQKDLALDQQTESCEDRAKIELVSEQEPKGGEPSEQEGESKSEDQSDKGGAESSVPLPASKREREQSPKPVARVNKSRPRLVKLPLAADETKTKPTEGTDPIDGVMSEMAKLRENSTEMISLVKDLIGINQQLSSCLDKYRSMARSMKTQADHLATDSNSVDMSAINTTLRQPRQPPQSKNEPPPPGKDLAGGRKKYEIIDDSSSGEEELPARRTDSLLDHVYVIQSHKGDRTVDQLVKMLSERSIGSDQIDVGPKKRFNQVLKTILNDSVQKGHNRIAVIHGNEVTLHSKFFDLLERQLAEINPEFHLLFLCNKLAMPQLKEWSRSDPDYRDYTFLYDDMKNMSEKAVLSHWKAYGSKEFRVPKIAVELSKSNVDNRWGVVINQPAIGALSQMLGSMSASGLSGDAVLIEYQKKYGQAFYCLPNLLIPRQPNVPRLRKICASNGWFHHFFEAKA